MAKMQEYYVEFRNSYCTLMTATTPSAAMKAVNRQYSQREREYSGCEARSARLATPEDRALFAPLKAKS